MTHRSEDLFEKFRTHRSERTRRPAPKAISGDINELLDCIDRVFGRASGDEGDAAAPLIEALGRVADALEEVEKVAIPPAISMRISRFLAATRVQVHDLIARAREADAPSGPIEIELTYDALHEFMMAPDVDAWRDAQAG